MKTHSTFRHLAALFFVAFALVPFLRTASAHTIRCADPDCKLCLSVPGAESPKKAETREPRNRPEDAPFGREASLAVVNPVMRSQHQSVVSLRGDWEFVTDSDAVGLKEGWMTPGKAWSGSRSLVVPGNWESQGVGEPAKSTPWICYWDNNARPFRHVYIGSAWYRKSFSVPKEWQGQRIWLKSGGVRAQGWFWVNGREAAKMAQYCGSFRFDITDLVTPGEEATVVALIRNDVPSRTGLFSACHIWGGIHRDVEIEATPEVHLANVECFGNFDAKNVKVRLEIAHPEGTGKRKAEVGIVVKTLDRRNPTQALKTVANVRKSLERAEGAATESFLEIDLPDFRPWSPESPDLYLAEVSLYGPDGKTVVHGWSERFGVKKFEVRGKRFYLNDKPYFLRGYGDDYIYPETFISPIDRDVHRKNLRVAKAAGFVFVRHHTHSEIPEYYDAADELGIMVQPELPYYPFNGFHTTEFFDFDPKRDLREVIDHYRRHVSTTAYSMGNEGHLGTPLDNELKQIVHDRDPGRLAMHNDGGVNTPENSDFDTPNSHFSGGTSIVPWKPGAFDRLTMPFIAHEYMNLGLKFDPRISERFTGVILPPRPIDRYEKRLAGFGLDRRWGDACLDAGHALQKHYQKQGIEAARLDPECDGYSYWTLVDVIVDYGGEDAFTGQGMFNPFHEPKSNGTTPEHVAKFNGPTTLLMKPDRKHPILVEGETVRLSALVSHFGYENIAKGTVVWTLKTRDRVLLEGRIDDVNAATGDVKEIGVIEFTVPKTAKASELTFELRLAESDIRNDWRFWLFPKRARKSLKSVAATPNFYETLSRRYEGLLSTDSPESKDAELVIGPASHPATAQAIAEGKRVLILGDAGGPPNVSLGWWWIGDQTGTAFADHPGFGDFPHDGFISPLWFRLIKRGLPISGDGAFGKMEHLAVGEGRNDYFLYAAQTRSGEKGGIFLTHGLDLLSETPEGTCLLDEIVAYLQSEAFQPKTQLDLSAYLEEIRLREEALSGLNGWSKTISSPMTTTGNYFVGPATIRFMYFNAPNEIVWESAPVDEPGEGDEQTYTFRWLFGVGFVPERSLDVSLSLGDKEAIPFKANVSDQAWSVVKGDMRLEYRRLAFVGNESTGVMSLTVPRKILTGGKTSTLSLRCENRGFSDSWVGIIEKALNNPSQ